MNLYTAWEKDNVCPVETDIPAEEHAFAAEEYAQRMGRPTSGEVAIRVVVKDQETGEQRLFSVNMELVAEYWATEEDL